jgi:hypothetical protein
MRVADLRTNAPVDLLVAAGNHTPEPRIHEASRNWQPGQPQLAEWSFILYGPSDGYDMNVYPVVEQEDGLACIDEEGRLLPFEGANPPEACMLVGAGFNQFSPAGTSNLFLASLGLILLGMLGALGLGIYVLRTAPNEAPGLSLGSYLVLAGVGFGSLAGTSLFSWLTGRTLTGLILPFDENLLIFPAMALLPGALLTFAVSYPTLHPRLRGHRGWPLVTVGPAVGLAGYLVVSFLVDDGPNVMPLSRGIPLIGSFILSAGLSAWIFRRRARDASTDLEHQRLVYMAKAVALPFAVGGSVMLAVYVSDVLGLIEGWASGLIALAVAFTAIGPAAGMAWGLLRYKIVDLESKLRFTVSRGFVVSVFVAVFFVASEAAETFFTDTIGPYAGLIAAGALVLLISPLERLGRRLAEGVVEEPVDEEEYERFRKLEVYRATYEEATADDSLTERERRTLDSLADNLGLSEDESGFIEQQVQRERQGSRGGEATPQPA